MGDIYSQQQLRQVDDFLASREMAAKGGTDYKTALHELVCMEVDQAVSDCQQQLVAAREALARMLPLALKLFNNTVTAAHERGTPLEPTGVTFEDLKFVQLSRAALSYTADSSQALPAGSAPQVSVCKK